MLVLLFLGTAMCFAQAPLVVSAAVDKTTLAADEVVELTITIKGADSASQEPMIDLPALEDNFTVVASAQSSNITMRGAEMQVNWQLRYSLVPKKEGALTIESATVVYREKTYTTDALTLTVTPAKNPLPPSPQKKENPRKFPWSDKEGIEIYKLYSYCE